MSNRSRTIWLLASMMPFGAMASGAPAPRDQVDIVSLKSGSDWLIVNDGVMGGLSQSSFRISDKGVGVFSGQLSLENNGGFASVRTAAIARNLSDYSGIKIRVKGDGRDYQLRLRTDSRMDGVAYRSSFPTQEGVWETIVVGFDEFLPSRRGRILENMPPLNPDEIRQVGFLVTGDKPGQFSLEVEFVQAELQKRTEQ